ncbi:MAG: hypothetical protein RL708_1327 [Bacteroidota bacterium]|jgi:hypothetical protein
MSNKNKKTIAETIVQPNHIQLISSSIKPNWLLYVVLFFVPIAFYFNSIFNEYALDDAMMITQNEYTLKGFDGIGDQLTHSFIYGFSHKEADDAASSHWRPLALISFNFEVGFWGVGHPHRSHLINVLLYALICVLLFYFLFQQLKINQWISFFTILLFAIHPIHTEVVANIKGRDELLALLFTSFSLIVLWKYIETKNPILYILSVVLFFIALTSKEAPMVFLGGIGCLLYFFTDYKIPKIGLVLIGYFIAIALLVFIKNEIAPFSNVIESREVMNNPFLYASPIQRICTKIFILLLYLKMLFVPYPLAYDYSFHQIPFVDANNIFVYLSITIYAALAVFAFVKLKSKSLISFSIFMFFITASISSNLIIDIGMAMGERLLFIPSLFFIMSIVIIAKQMIDLMNEKLKINKWIPAIALLLPIFMASAFVTFARNKEWKNDIVLNIADFKKCPNSARIANGAGTSYIELSAKNKISKTTRDSLLFIALNCFNQALKIHPTFDDAFLNRGVAYSRMDSVEAAERNWNVVRQHANHPKLIEFNKYLTAKFLTIGLACGNRKNLDSAINYLEKAAMYATENDSLTMDSYYNLGGAYYTAGKFEKAKIAFTKTMQLNPTYKDTKMGLAASEFELSKTKKP